MLDTLQKQPRQVAPWSRVAIMLAGLAGVLLAARLVTGSFFPVQAKEAIVFQNALLLIILGSAVIEHKYTKPADSVVNSLMGMITLLSVYAIASPAPWWGVFLYCVLVFTASTMCIVVSTGKHLGGWRRRVADITYAPSVLLGKSRVIFSVLFIYAVLEFFGHQASATLTLILFWGAFIVVWPLGLPELLTAIFSRRRHAASEIGKVIRVDFPNLVRVALSPSVQWDPSSAKVLRQIDGKSKLVVPLYAQQHGDELVGTGLCVTTLDQVLPGLDAGFIYEPPPEVKVLPTDIAKSLGGGDASRLVGFVIEDSTIADIRFETWEEGSVRAGMLVWCPIGKDTVYYQVTNGTTREESLESNRHGFQYATATQLGIIDSAAGFVKHLWLPNMNTPVFAEPEGFASKTATTREGDFLFGTLPGTAIPVGGPLREFMDHHTAILGVTGSGKTQLAFDIIRYAIANSIKVICIDLTARYQDKLADLKPQNLSLAADVSADLGKKLFEAETGAYGAGAEKKVLANYADKLRASIAKSIEGFLASEDEANRLAIITLEEISNTKATLYITELYLTSLLHYARDHSGKCPRVLIVVEEAHTAMPEPSMMGLGDHDSRGLVSKITQIALQGRKYKVGLLVIAQRTATVSKSVLTQCNTVISFNCFDDTSLSFLSNILGAAHVLLIPNLPPLNAVIFGKAIRSQRPLIVQIPFDPKKVDGGA